MNIEIKLGDYIEGYEYWGIALDGKTKPIHITRVVVDSISQDSDGHKIYSGRADDVYNGARGGSINTKLGKVRLITDEEPFSNTWWAEYEKQKSWKRNWKAFDLVRDFKGNQYRVIGSAVDENEKELILIKNADGTGVIQALNKEHFESEIKRKEYPSALQGWLYVKIDDNGNEVDNSI